MFDIFTLSFYSQDFKKNDFHFFLFMQPLSASGSCFPEVNIDSFSILLKISHEFIQVALQLFKIHLSLSFTL